MMPTNVGDGTAPRSTRLPGSCVVAMRPLSDGMAGLSRRFGYGLAGRGAEPCPYVARFGSNTSTEDW